MLVNDTWFFPAHVTIVISTSHSFATLTREIVMTMVTSTGITRYHFQPMW